MPNLFLQKKHLIIILVLFHITSCSTVSQRKKLTGMFVFDQNQTLEYLKNTGSYTDEHLKRLSSVLREMKITYNADNIAITEYDGNINKEKFKIIDSFPDSLLIEYGKCDRYKIIFHNNGYWISGGIMPPPYREFYRKLQPKESN